VFIVPNLCHLFPDTFRHMVEQLVELSDFIFSPIIQPRSCALRVEFPHPPIQYREQAIDSGKEEERKHNRRNEE